jgi:hypothetical protein
MELKGWKEKMGDRKQWRLVVEEAKAHPGLWRRVAGSPNDGAQLNTFHMKTETVSSLRNVEFLHKQKHNYE